MQRFSLFILLILGCLSCFDAPSFSDIPRIVDVRFEKSSEVSTPSDRVIMLIDFEDGNGDLGGFMETDSSFGDIFIANLDIPELVELITIESIPNRGSVDDISGTVKYSLQTTGEAQAQGAIATQCRFISSGKLDTLRYSVQMRDLAGNLSNEFVAPEIIIDCR